MERPSLCYLRPCGRPYAEKALDGHCCLFTVEYAQSQENSLQSEVLEVELGGHFYVHQFVVMDVSEGIILGMDFIVKYQVSCNWHRGILVLKGKEVQACRRYSTGDGKVRMLKVSEKTVLPAFSQVRVGVRVRGGDPGGLPEWGMA